MATKRLIPTYLTRRYVEATRRADRILGRGRRQFPMPDMGRPTREAAELWGYMTAGERRDALRMLRRLDYDLSQ